MIASQRTGAVTLLSTGPEVQEVTEPARGWRYYALHPRRGQWVLLGNAETTHAARISSVAICRAGREHLPPAWGCSCGYYAWYPHVGLIRGTSFSVRAYVTGWGTVVYCEEGWRAQQIRLEALFVSEELPESVGASLAMRFEVPVYKGEEAYNEYRQRNQDRQGGAVASGDAATDNPTT